MKNKSILLSLLMFSMANTVFSIEDLEQYYLNIIARMDQCRKIKNPDESNACLKKMHSEFPIEKSFINPETGNRIELSIHNTTGENGEQIITAIQNKTTFDMPSRILKVSATTVTTDSSKPNASKTDEINKSVLCENLLLLLSLTKKRLNPEESSLCEEFYKFYKISVPNNDSTKTK